MSTQCLLFYSTIPTLYRLKNELFLLAITKTVEADHTNSTTSTITVIGNQNIDSHSTVDKVVLKNYLPKINNSTKYHSNDLTIKTTKDEKEYIQDKKTSQAYSMEAVAFFDRLNFDDPNIDESEIEYIENSI